MYTIRDHHTADLFDPWEHLGEKRRRLLGRSWAGVFREHLLNHLPVEQVASHFRKGFGRPTKDLHVAVGALILQQLHDLTDAAAVEALALHTTWHFALDIRDESDAYLCEKTLRNYRLLVIEHGLDEVIFRHLTDRLISAFAVDTGKQRLDSTSIRSAMRSLTRLELFVETIAKFLRELARRCPDLHGRIDPDLVRRHVGREGPGCFALAKPSQSRHRLPEAARDLLELVTMFRGTQACALESFSVLERLLDEQCEVTDEGGGPPQIALRPPGQISGGSLQNPSDPDATYNAHRGKGYMAQVMGTYEEDDDVGEQSDEAREAARPDLITHVAVHAMTVHDGQRLEPALEDVSSRGLAPEVLVADTSYGPADNVHRAAEQGVELISPAMAPKGSRHDRLTLEDFEVDESGEVARCPGGHAPTSTSAWAKNFQARFDPSHCGGCPLAERCPIGSALARGVANPRLLYTHERLAHRRRRLRERTEIFKDRYRWRAGAEATMSRLKHQMHLASVRVRGLASVRFVTHLRALGLNIRRCAAVWAAA